MDNAVTTILALGTPLVQVLLMGMIGYSWARSKPSRMPAFNRSGFYWWVIALLCITVVALALSPQQISVQPLTGHDWSLSRFFVSSTIGYLAAILIEATYEFLASRLSPGGVPRSQQKYEDALPITIRRYRLELASLAVVGSLEEIVYRGIALSGLLFWVGLPEFWACGISAVAFGLGHLYFGVSQLFIKSLLGGVFCAVALSAGWPAALFSHVALNLTLICIGNYARSTDRQR